jgi:hypothetical protein
MKMDKRMKMLTILTAIAIMAVATVGAITVWQWLTRIKVIEPFEIKTNLPTEEVLLYPGNYSYWINVTNHGGETLNATLYYTITTVNCAVDVSPPNGASYKVEAGKTVSIPVTITVYINEYPANGTATIDWRIERVKP